MRSFGAVIFALSALAAFETLAAEPDDERVRKVFQAAIANPNEDALVQAFITELPEVPHGSGKFIVEGDILLNRAEIVPYLQSFSEVGFTKRNPTELIVNEGPGGEYDYWKDPASRHLTYAIESASFPSAVTAEDVARRLRDAADEWEAACIECGVEFEEKTEAEAGPNFSQVSFRVRFQPVGGGATAHAFFPSSAPGDFVLSIFPKFFAATLSFDKTGILRHELGHILGYRHEHVGNPASKIPGCEKEGSSWTPLTPYSPNSVMHYFCGGIGGFDLSLRQTDKQGHRCLYLTGKPCPQIE